MNDCRHRRDSGFTLIELTVVILLIGVLSAIAVPNLIGQRERGQRATAVSDLRNAAVIIEGWAASHGGNYSGLNGLAGDAGVLVQEGYRTSSSMQVTIWSTASTYCLEGIHEGLVNERFVLRSDGGQVLVQGWAEQGCA